ncbi:unnamed protein product, partial [Tetraodon nigroviridis]
HTSADADSRSQRTCGPPASLWLRLPGPCRIHPASTSARLRLWQVETPPPPSHSIGLELPSLHLSVLHQTRFFCLSLSFSIAFSTPSTGQQVVLQTNFFFYSPSFFFLNRHEGLNFFLFKKK